VESAAPKAHLPLWVPFGLLSATWAEDGFVNKGSGWVAFLLLLPVASAGELSKETLTAWDDYVHAATACMTDRLQPQHSFLWIDEHPELLRQVRAGKLAVAPMVAGDSKHVPSGLIHHWIGVIFLPNVRLDDVFSVVRDYDHYKNIYPSAVLESKAIRQDGADDRFSILLISKAALVKTALASEDQSTYFRVDSRRWYSISYTVRVQEIEDFGGPNQHTLPPDQGHGYIWRLYGINRFEERDGGVYLEAEAMALSRDIPAAVRWVVGPIVKRVARDSMTTSLRRTEEAVGAAAAAASRQVTQQPASIQPR
jgi:hypothetical protein